MANYTSEKHHRENDVAGPDTLLVGAYRSLDNLADRLFHLAQELNSHADRVFGPPPPQALAAGGSPKEAFSGEIGALLEQIDRGGQGAQAIEDAISRFNSL